tara:strand:- start:1546 stop:1890 length:345 start_codon:yes stop_codon:yes gene_type:complete
MAMIGGKLNLTAFKHAIKKGKSGQECLVIPIDDNNLFKSTKGNVYLDIIAFEIRNPQAESKDTHIVKQSKPEDKRSNEDPIIGNLSVLSSGGGESAPTTAVSANPLQEEDDFPF